MSASEVSVKSKPENVYRALLDAEMLAQWWGCQTVIDARPGGIWAGGWGRGPGGIGHQTVLCAELSALTENQLVTFKIGQTEISFDLQPDPAGCRIRVSQEGFPSDSPQEELDALQSWVDAAQNLKAYVESKFPYTPPAAAPQAKPAQPSAAATPQAKPAQPSAAATPQAKPARPSAAGAGGGAAAAGGKASDPYGGLEAMAQGDYRVLDDAGFGVTDPWAVIKSWSKEQGFGYVTHEKLGDVVFDYDGCDFEPTVGDKVVLLVIGKRFDGKPKVKRIACPAKGSKLSK